MYREACDASICQCCNKPIHSPLYVHGRCHVDAANVAVVYADHVEFLCSRCGRPIIAIAIVSNGDVRPGPVTACCGGLKVWGSWFQGHVQVDCGKCNKPMFRLPIRSSIVPGPAESAN